MTKLIVHEQSTMQAQTVACTSDASSWSCWFSGCNKS